MLAESINKGVVMTFKVQRREDKNKGTIYGVFHKELLIHNEYSRSAADQIVDQLKSGTLLSDILSKKIEYQSNFKLNEQISIEKEKSENLSHKVHILQLQINEFKQCVTKPEHLDHQILYDIIRIMSDYELECTHAIEFHELVIEVKNKRFTYSIQLSKYIVQSNLQNKYPNISGVVKMQDADREWNLDGGFPRKIFALVCQELNLKDQGSNAKAVGFTPFKELNS